MILREIANVIDEKNRGSSKHDQTWRSTAISIGCDGEPKGHIEIKENRAP